MEIKSRCLGKFWHPLRYAAAMTDGDRALLRQFESCSLPFDQWTHRAHVRVGYLYLCDHPFDEALDRMRRGVRRYNAANDVPEGPTSGYNETTTHAFLHLIAAVRAAYGVTHPVDGSETFCDAHPQLMNKHALRLFYSPRRRMDPAAKTRFVEPDLAPLPRIVDGARTDTPTG
jgi:hypothetical protein